MSSFYQVGDIVYVNCSTDTSGQNGIALPENNIAPLEWGIADLGADDAPTLYIPFRIYAGDLALARATREGAALIPEEVSGIGVFADGGGDTGTVWATETVESNGINCLGNACPEYGSKPFYCKKAGGTVAFTPGATRTLPCNYCTFLGWSVRGSDSSTSGGDTSIEVFSSNAYEYIELTVTEGSFDIASGDAIEYSVSSVANWPPPYPIQYSSSGSKVIIEAYPGWGGCLGFPTSEGGYGKFSPTVKVGGGRNSYRTEYDIGYSPVTRQLSFQFVTTGRYGNYQ